MIQPWDVGIGGLFERVPDAVVVVDTAVDAIVLWNPGAERLFGYTALEAQGLTVASLIPEPLRARHKAGLTHYHATGHGRMVDTRLPMELPALHKSGAVLTIELTLSPLETAIDGRRFVLAIIRDLSERRQAEEARAAARELRESNQQMDVFLGVVSHELRGPLTVVRGNLELAERRLGGVKAASGADTAVAPRIVKTLEVLRRAVQAVDRLDVLARDLLDTTRIQANRLELRLESLDLSALARDIVREQRTLTPTHPIHLDLPRVPPALVTADATRVRQVLHNYLTNALKYAPGPEPITVSLRGEAAFARVSVRDRGPGLAVSEQELIWSRFYQVDNVESRGRSAGGLGLGLYISRLIVEAHGGAVGVRSTPGRGATFWFTLPLTS